MACENKGISWVTKLRQIYKCVWLLKTKLLNYNYSGVGGDVWVPLGEFE
jgi:hypothetical protein